MEPEVLRIAPEINRLVDGNAGGAGHGCGAACSKAASSAFIRGARASGILTSSTGCRRNNGWLQPEQEREVGFPTAIFVQQVTLTTPDTLLWPARSPRRPIRRLAVTHPGESLNFLEPDLTNQDAPFAFER